MLERLLPHVLFEMPEGGGGEPPAAVEPVAPGAGEGAPGGSGAGELPVAPEAAPSTPAAPAIDWDSPDVQAELARRAGPMAQQAVREMLGRAIGEPEQPAYELDPWSDDFGQQIVGLLGAVLDQRLGPVDSMVQAQTVQGFEQTINGAIAKLTGSDLEGEAAQAAEFHGLDPEGIRFLGEAFATRVDPSGADPIGDALRQGAAWLKTHDASVAEAAVNAYKRQIGEIVDTPAEPAASGGALRMEPTGGSYDDRIERVLARHGIGQ